MAGYLALLTSNQVGIGLELPKVLVRGVFLDTQLLENSQPRGSRYPNMLRTRNRPQETGWITSASSFTQW
jgi:hypothetical protein